MPGEQSRSSCEDHQHTRTTKGSPLTIEVGHGNLVVAGSLDRADWNGLLGAGVIFGGELKGESADDVVPLGDLAGAEDRKDVLSAGENPGDGDLDEGGVVPGGDGLELGDARLVGGGRR